ncbi:MAG TPA: alpha-ketoglutarate-dependent dioxygenase AlkB [Acidimicrobiia bacterium]|nr:alpha-ketoglutarate-dependent dioxygenase AlkB [Acidimicrobiia bacterium]
MSLNPDASFEHHELDGSWIEIARGFLLDADAVYDDLVATVPWRQGRVFRYERWIDEPRLGAGYSIANAPHPALADAHHALQQRYHVDFDGFGLAYYRDARDSVAMHRDREMRWLDDTVIAILTLGAQRPFLVQRRNTYDRSTARDLSPAGGDLLVFGGRFQADWLHGVPKVPHAVRGRISVQWRHTTKRGRPEIGPGYRAPRHFSTSARRRS